MFKFQLGQLVYFISGAEIASSVVCGRKCVDYKENYAVGHREKFIWGTPGIIYDLSSCEVIPEEFLFASKEELVQSLLEKSERK